MYTTDKENCPKVLICILNWNNIEDTLHCLNSISQLEYSNFAILIIDNGSNEDPSERILEKNDKIILKRNNINLGYTGANNQGIDYAIQIGADYIWLLNNDTIVEPNTLRNLITTAETSQNIGLVSPVVYYLENKEKILFCGGYYDLDTQYKTFTRNLELSANWQKNCNKNLSLWGTALLVKISLVKEIGKLDERFFAYNEDIDYSIRSIKAGFSNLIDYSARVYHRKKQYVVGVNQYPPHYYFYTTRNEYFLWTKFMSKPKKILYLRSYLIKVFQTVANCKEKKAFVESIACLDGFWSAIYSQTGSYDDRKRMPKWLRSILIYRPFFLLKVLG